MVPALLLASGIKASVAVETDLPVPTSLSNEASIMGSIDVQTGRKMHTFALVCGLLAFAAAGQQAIIARGAVMRKFKVTKD